MPFARVGRTAWPKVASLMAVAILLGLVVTPVTAGAVIGAPPAGRTTMSTNLLKSGYPYNLQFAHSGRCIDIPGAVSTNVQLEQYTCVLQSNEYWYIDGAVGGPFRIRSALTGKCMNVQGAHYVNGAAIIQYPCGAYNNELWNSLQIDANPDYLIYAEYDTNMCLNIAGASTANGAKLQLYTCGDYANEHIYAY